MTSGIDDINFGNMGVVRIVLLSEIHPWVQNLQSFRKTSKNLQKSDFMILPFICFHLSHNEEGLGGENIHI